MNNTSLQNPWFSNIRGDVLAGIVVALALIPEAIGFSIIAGVDPRVGLYASVVIAIVISFATTALLLVVLIASRGLTGTDHVDGEDGDL